MTVIRIAMLAVLLGSAAAALIWFSWGAIHALLAGRGANAKPSEETKDVKRNATAKPAKPA